MKPLDRVHSAVTNLQLIVASSKFSTKVEQLFDRQCRLLSGMLLRSSAWFVGALLWIIGPWFVESETSGHLDLVLAIHF